MGSYTFTPHALASSHALGVVESGVALIAAGTATIIPFERVAAVQLWFDPTRFDAERYRCRISARNGEEILFQSSTCTGLGSFTAQSDDYRAVVLDLHARLAVHGGEVRYMAGVGGLRYAANVGCVGLVLLVLGVVLLTVGFSLLGPFAFIQLLVMAWLTPRAVRWVRRNRPVAYLPTAIPAQVLPPAGAIMAVAPEPVPVPVPEPAAPVVPPAPVQAQVEAAESEKDRPIYMGPGRRYEDEDFGPIAAENDSSWCSAGGQTTHWADAMQYAKEANRKLDAGLIGPPKDPPPQGIQPL